jgi:para-aminobenzoate synthetase component 1
MNKVIEHFTETMNQMGSEGTPFLFVVDYEMNNPLIFRLDEAAKRGVYYDIGGLRNYEDILSETQPLIFRKNPIDYSKYLDAFNKVLNAIRFGNTFLLNLTFPTEIETNWSMRSIFEKSTAPYRLLFKDQFVLFSPECFVKISDGVISSYPMKGTIDSTIVGADQVILSDEKEKAEHATIVDLIRNDLSMVADHVRVKRYRYLDEIVAHDKKLLQVSSEITGILPEDYRSKLGSIIWKLLPAGSICGAPKASTLKIIKETENYQRGYYTGVFGIFDGSGLDSAVMIRYIEKSENRYFYKSGGGITIYSDPMKEYRELIDKVYVATY